MDPRDCFWLLRQTFVRPLPRPTAPDIHYFFPDIHWGPHFCDSWECSVCLGKHVAGSPSLLPETRCRLSNWSRSTEKAYDFQRWLAISGCQSRLHKHGWKEGQKFQWTQKLQDVQGMIAEGAGGGDKLYFFAHLRKALWRHKALLGGGGVRWCVLWGGGTSAPTCPHDFQLPIHCLISITFLGVAFARKNAWYHCCTQRGGSAHCYGFWYWCPGGHLDGWYCGIKLEGEKLLLLSPSVAQWLANDKGAEEDAGQSSMQASGWSRRVKGHWKEGAA